VQGFVDVLGLDGERSAVGGVEPCGLGEQVGGSGVEDIALESGTGDVPVEVAGDVLAGEFDEPRSHATLGTLYNDSESRGRLCPTQRLARTATQFPSTRRPRRRPHDQHP